MAAPLHRPTIEQQAVLDSRAPLRLTIANAGSGKTALMAMLYAKLYLEEEAAYLKDNPKTATNDKGHLANEPDIIAICKNFDAITFTRKAAAELDARVRHFLQHHGVTIPKGRRLPNGNEIRWRLARTLDSKTQQIFFHPLFLKLFIEQNKGWGARLDQMVDILASNPQGKAWFEKRKKESTRSDEPTWAKALLFQQWGCQLVDQDQAAVSELAILEYLGWSRGRLGQLEDHVERRLRTITLAELEAKSENGAKGNLLAEIRSDVKRASARFSDALEQYLKDNDNLKPEERKKLIDFLEPYHKKERLVREFTTAYELARRKGYRPGHGFEPLTQSEVLTTIADIGETERGTVSLADFDAIAVSLEKAKRALGVLDFTDFASAIIEGLSSNSFLLELNRDRPRLGFRRRHTVLDEAQDLDPAQWELAELVQKAMGAGNTLNVVGDPGQSIYRYRGAEPEGMERLFRGKDGEDFQRYHLSHCFRSAPEIVDLGNNIIETLSIYRQDKKPSIAAHTGLQGKIKIWAPKTEFEEAEWVLQAAKRTLATGETLMILYRSNGEKTATYRRLVMEGLLKDGPIQFISTHASKGLEADHVILIGCTAGRWPDPRGDEQQELNLWYVACTRARTQLTISCPLHETKLNKTYELEDTAVGPSPYLKRVPQLLNCWIREGYGTNWLEEAEQTHAKACAERHRTRVTRLTQLEAEAKALGIKIWVNPPPRRAIFAGGQENPQGTKAWIESQKQQGHAPQPEQGDTAAAIEREMSKAPPQNLGKMTPQLYRLLLRTELTRDRKSNLVPTGVVQAEWQLGWAAGWWIKEVTGKWKVTERYLAAEEQLLQERRNRLKVS